MNISPNLNWYATMLLWLRDSSWLLLTCVIPDQIPIYGYRPSALDSSAHHAFKALNVPVWSGTNMEVAQRLKYKQGLVLDTFTCFPKLPLELRLKIWAFTIRRRILTIEPCSERERSYRPRSYPVKAHVVRQPALLHVNSESRQVALQYYSAFKPLFGKVPVFFNHQLDGLYLKDTGSFMSFWLAILQDKHIKSCIEKNVRVLVIENMSGMQLAQIMKQALGIEEALCHYPRFNCPDLEDIRATSVGDFEAIFRKD